MSRATKRANELTISEVAGLAQVHTATVRRWINESRRGFPRLRAVRRGRFFYVPRQSWDEFCERWPWLNKSDG